MHSGIKIGESLKGFLRFECYAKQGVCENNNFFKVFFTEKIEMSKLRLKNQRSLISNEFNVSRNTTHLFSASSANMKYLDLFSS